MKAISQFFLRLLARRFPALWEIIGGGPLGRVAQGQTRAGAQDPGGEVSLNPQPLPPKAASR